MRTYKSQTKNGGTTIILDNVEQAIDYGRKFYEERPKANSFDGMSDANIFGNDNHKNYFEDCVKALLLGDPTLMAKTEEIIDDVLDLVDAIQPTFTLAQSGYERSEEGITTTTDLIMSGEPNNTLSKKVDEQKEVKKGSGEGAYRIIINTDVCWWGTPEMNCGLVGALIVLLQRYMPVEVWIQQGWLGYDPASGVTLFKLDYEAAVDVTSLSFWICHPGKDSPFSFAVNRGLGRKNSDTSCTAELECDIMFRGDWQEKYGVTYCNFNKMMYTEKIDLMAKYIADTGYKIIYGENMPPLITE